MTDKTNITDNREDISRFVVHLTRDDSKTWPYGGASARDNLETILEEGRVGAYRTHCLHAAALKDEGEKIEAKFKVACFTSSQPGWRPEPTSRSEPLGDGTNNDGIPLYNA